MSAVLNQAQVTLERTVLTIMTKRISAFHVMLRLRCFLYARCLHYTCCVIVVLFYVTYCQKTHFIQILVKFSCRNAKQPWEMSNNLWNPLIVDMVHYLGHRNRTVYANFKCLQKKMPREFGWRMFTAFRYEHNLSHDTKEVCEGICLSRHTVWFSLEYLCMV